MTVMSLALPSPYTIERCREALFFSELPYDALPELNEELLTRTLEYIANHPTLWMQNSYRAHTPCGTAYCFAGWTAEIAGGKWVPDHAMNHNLPEYELPFRLYAEEDDEPGDFVLCPDRARRILGLTDIEANTLFHPENTWEDLKAYVWLLINERGT